MRKIIFPIIYLTGFVAIFICFNNYFPIFAFTMGILIYLIFDQANQLVKMMRATAPNSYILKSECGSEKKVATSIIQKHFPYYGRKEIGVMLEKELLKLSGNDGQLARLLEEAKKKELNIQRCEEE